MIWDFFHVFSLLPHLAYAIPFKQHTDHYSFAQSISPKPDMTEDRGLKSYIFYSISFNHHKALINPKDKPASLEWQRSVLCVRGRTWFSSCSKCFFQCLSCVCLVGGGRVAPFPLSRGRHLQICSNIMENTRFHSLYSECGEGFLS